MVRLTPRTDGRDDGAVAIIVALFSLVLFGLAAVVVDLGDARDVRAQLQDAADAGALAGAQAFNGTSCPATPDAARVTCIAAAVKGVVDTDAPKALDWACTVSTPPSGYQVDASGCVFVDLTGNAVEVVTPLWSVPSTLGGVVGVNHVDVSVVAAADLDGDSVARLCDATGPAANC